MPANSIELPDVSGSHSSALAAVDFAMDYLAALLKRPRFSKPTASSETYLRMRRDLPYVVHETSISGIRILVNRNYKPLGNGAGTHANFVNYEATVNLQVRISQNDIAKISTPGRESCLFGDANPPWAGKREAGAYFTRLSSLRQILATQPAP
jgi:hypothetical protein